MDTSIIAPSPTSSSEQGAGTRALRVLIADDSENDVLVLLRVLRKAGYQPVYERVCTAPAKKAALRQAWAVMISDYEMPNFGGFDALQLLKQSGHHLPFIPVSAVVSGETAAALTRQFMTYSRKRVIDPRVVKLNAVILNIESMLRRLIGEDIEFGTLLDSAAGHIKADPGQIEQVIMNLAVNTRDAMPNGGKLSVATANTTLGKNHVKNLPDLCAGDYVMITIADTGTGMSEEVKAH